MKIVTSFARFAALLAALVIGPLLTTAYAGSTAPYTQEAFKAAQAAGQPILVEVHADWCPTCKAQESVLNALKTDPKFDKLVTFRVNYDQQKQVLREFNAQAQSTLIVFKGASEVGRSVGDTRRASIESLVGKSL
ncbi:MAG: thiol reductase thioredoxin [Proteobacteria bacterium SG_bin9]|nr:MAG: thiol reductase thioredoxin [Proteobacteria bacterium SG_bin9]